MFRGGPLHLSVALLQLIRASPSYATTRNVEIRIEEAVQELFNCNS